MNAGGMKCGWAGLGLALGLVVGAGAAQAEALKVVHQVAVGKWPEGVAVSERIAWVAESGARQVAAVNLDTGAVAFRAKAGRLPVEVVADGSQVHALSHTDQRVWRLDAARKAATVVKAVDDCPQHMDVADGGAWVLLWKACSSAGSSVVRVGLDGKSTRRSPELGADAWQVAHGHGHLWVARGKDQVTVLDAATLKPVAEVALPGRHMQISAGPQGIYVAAQGVLNRIDPATRAPSGQATFAARVAAIWVDADGLAVVEDGGALSRLAPVTLAVIARYESPVADLKPRALARDGARWLVTSHGAAGDQSETGVLYVLAVPGA